MSDYDRYVKDEAFLAYYNDYQKQYAGQIAERDKVMLGFIAQLTEGQGSLLDIGCSTGNLLLHVKRAFPNLKLHGGELAESSLAAARANPDLSGVAFRAMDMLDLPGKYDCITENAVAYLFDWPEYERAMRSVANAVNVGGHFISLDWYHPFSGQDLVIRETTRGHPNGLTIYVRSYERVADVLMKVGFDDVEFHPFDIPIDLPEPVDKSGDPITYTIKTERGDRLCMRGALFQPWCHVTARKT